MHDQYRQGHILLVRVTALPAGAVPHVGDRPDHHVIAHGESGREHVFKGGRVAIFMEGGTLFVEILGDDPVWLDHPEHGNIAVEPGIWRVVEQQEDDGEVVSLGQAPAPRRSYD
jgi:hypothetical protein